MLKKILRLFVSVALVTSGFALSGCGAQDNTGKKVKVDYVGTFEDGAQFDSSYDRGEPIEFTVGAGQMISGFDDAVKDMVVGEEKTITLLPDQAYGEYDQTKVVTVNKSQILQGTATVGGKVYVRTSKGNAQGTVTAIDGDNVTVDTNNEMAGKTLIFDIKLEEIE